MNAALVQLVKYVGASVDLSGLPKVNADKPHLFIILNTFFGVLGSIALLTLIIAGMRYVTSNGDPNTMSKTKNTIIYAGVGLAVSMSAFAIVSFALSHV